MAIGNDVDELCYATLRAKFKPIADREMNHCAGPLPPRLDPLVVASSCEVRGGHAEPHGTLLNEA